MLSRLVLSVTNRCPIACPHCVATASPRGRARLTLREMRTAVDDMFGLGRLRMVIFTGGEPFLLREDLLDMVGYCAAKGLTTRIVTNAFWARTPENASNIVQACLAAGLTELAVSCDEYHQKFISIDNVRHANDACREQGLPCALSHKIMKGNTLTLERLEEALRRPLIRFSHEGDNPANDVVDSGYTVPLGENMHLIPDEDILYPDSDDHWKTPCDSALENTVITENRELAVCCGMIPRKVREVVFGPLGKYHLAELILQADRDLITNWLALEGPYGLMQFIQARKPAIPFRKRYVSRCHLCSEILTRDDCRAVLHAHCHEKVREISIKRAFYDHARPDAGH